VEEVVCSAADRLWRRGRLLCSRRVVEERSSALQQTGCGGGRLLCSRQVVVESLVVVEEVVRSVADGL